MDHENMERAGEGLGLPNRPLKPIPVGDEPDMPVPDETVEIRRPLEKELQYLLNRYCRENMSDTPDFILAQYMMNCLTAFEQAVGLRQAWFGHKTFNSGPEVPGQVDGFTSYWHIDDTMPPHKITGRAKGTISRPSDNKE